jgi:hypothetical protein
MALGSIVPMFSGAGMKQTRSECLMSERDKIDVPKVSQLYICLTQVASYELFVKLGGRE